MDRSAPEARQERIDLSLITNLETRKAASEWLFQRNINRNCYINMAGQMSDDQFDTRPAVGYQSPKQNLIYQIEVHTSNLYGLQKGELQFSHHGEDKELQNLTKEELIQKLDHLDKQIVEELIKGTNKTIVVPTQISITPLSIADFVKTFKQQEVYHIQNNRNMIAFANETWDLGIEEPSEAAAWGK